MVAFLLAPAFAGCLDAESLFSDGTLRSCDSPQPFTLYLGPGLSLSSEMPANGFTRGNGFNEAFLSNSMDEWHGPFSQRTWLIEGDIVLELWTREGDLPAPVILGRDPGEGYHFFNQVGTNRGFLEASAVSNGPVVPADRTQHLTQRFATPPGGILLEREDYVRLLLTHLALDADDRPANEEARVEPPAILWGPDAPSRIEFSATCQRDPVWMPLSNEHPTVVVPGHQGLITGAIPDQEGANYQDIPFHLHPETDRLTIRLDEAGESGPKNDMDLIILDANGDVNWGIGSPYNNERGTRWPANLDASMPPGDYTLRVNSYSGTGYVGQASIIQEVQA